MPEPKEIIESKQLVVEGRDAEVFFRALLHHLRVVGVQVQNYGGIDELPAFLKALSNADSFPEIVGCVGIIRDAETDPKGAFMSVCSALRNAGLPVPGRPQLSSEGVGPRVSVLILPDTARPGALETLCLEAVADDPAAECVDKYFDCIKERSRSFPKNMDKARVHAFLSSRPKPDLLLGEAARAGYWPWNSPAFDHVGQFLKSL